MQELGFSGLENGALLAALAGHCDVFLTADKNLRYQQNLAGRTMAIVELPTNRWPLLLPLKKKVVAAVEGCAPSAYIMAEME